MPCFYIVTPITLVIHTIIIFGVQVIKSVVHIYVKVGTVSALEKVFTSLKMTVAPPVVAACTEKMSCG